MLTLREVAQRLRVHPRTVLKMGREGRLPMVKIGPKTHRVPEAAVEIILSCNNAAKQQ